MSRKSKVGARSSVEVSNDPLATAEELYALNKTDSLAALRHPNCPLELWWALAGRYPLEAMQSPAGQLFLLEDPTRWRTIAQEHGEEWIQTYTGAHSPVALSDKALRLFAADCAAHVLPIYESRYPTDERPRLAIEAARKYANGRMSAHDLETARFYASNAELNAGPDAACSAASAAADCATLRDDLIAGELAMSTAAVAFITKFHEVKERSGRVSDADEAAGEERAWQWQRLTEYLMAPTGKVSGIERKRARSAKAIKADPQATSEEIEKLAKTERCAALLHPNCPTELWWELAKAHPIEAMSSLLYPLFALEAPERWEALELEHVPNWISQGLHRLSPSQKRLFACDCAERSLYIFEYKYPHEKRTRRALETARRFAQDEAASKDELYNAMLGAECDLNVVKRASRNSAGDDDSFYGVLEAVQAVAYAAADPHAYLGDERVYRYGTGEFAAYAAEEAANDAAKAIAADYEGLKFSAAMQKEQVWQWHHLLSYLAGKETIGARTYKSLRADPLATEADLRKMAKTRPLQALQHPNCPAELWWALAAKYPAEAKDSVLYGLLLIEEPERWVEIEKKYEHREFDAIDRWIDGDLRFLSPKDQRLFAADCAEHVLPLLRQGYATAQEDPQKAIFVARAFAQGYATKADLAAACYPHTGMANETMLEERILSAAAATTYPSAIKGAREAAYHAEQARAWHNEGKGWFGERQWQWARLRHYLKASEESVGAKEGKGVSSPANGKKAKRRIKSS